MVVGRWDFEYFVNTYRVTFALTFPNQGLFFSFIPTTFAREWEGVRGKGIRYAPEDQVPAFCTWVFSFHNRHDPRKDA